MADQIAAKVYGLPEFAVRLKALGGRDARNIARSGAAAAATVFRRSVAANAPVLRRIDLRKRNRRVIGALRRSVFSARSSRKSSPGKEVYVVSVRARGSKNSAFYWRWVEAGHIARGPGQRLRGGSKTKALQRKRIKSAGGAFVPGRWFIQRAFQGNQSKVVEAFNKKLGERIQKAERELNGR